jgi:hypothetical protein
MEPQTEVGKRMAKALRGIERPGHKYEKRESKAGGSYKYTYAHGSPTASIPWHDYSFQEGDWSVDMNSETGEQQATHRTKRGHKETYYRKAANCPWMKRR